MIKVLVIGPLPEPTTGVSLANKVVIENLKESGEFNVDYINTSYAKFEESLGSFSFAKAFFFLKLNFLAYKVLGSKKVYLTPGQTFFGVLKYSVFILLAWIFGREIIIHVHGNHLGKEFSGLKGFKRVIFKALLKKTSKGIILSESLTYNMSPFIESRNIYALYNFVEDYLFPTSQVVKNKAEGFNPRIIFLSNLMEGKGIFQLLEALTILEEKGVKYEARIAGNMDQKQKAKIESYFDGLEHTEYCGVVRGDAKRELLEWGTIFVLATDYVMEGQPISILEAMANGNIVLTTRHAGIPDIFKDNTNGLYVEKHSAESIAEKIEKILGNKDAGQKIILHNHKEAKEKYRVENFRKALIEILKA